MPLRKVVYHSEDMCDVKDAKPKVAADEAFLDDEVVCMICGRGGMKTLARHLNFIHNLKPGQYRKRFGLGGRCKLTSKNYSEERKRFVKERGSEKSLAKARASRLAKLRGLLPRLAQIAESVVNAKGKRSYRRLHVFPD